MIPDGTLAIVVLGGFLSPAAFYSGFSTALESSSGKKVFIVDTRVSDWLQSVSKPGWSLILDKLDITVKRAIRQSGDRKLTLIGHSQGGILARLYLSNEPFLGKSYCGLDYIDHLITLGSPHVNQGGIQRGGPMSRWVQQQVPDAVFAPSIHYTSVAGKFVRGDPSGSLIERLAFRSYQEIFIDGSVCGDGIVPVDSALLPDSEQIVLDGVSHYSAIGKPWYGSEHVLPLWYCP
jgi:pimeloyl-ACP methyl ester carboxylesterase